MKKIALLLAIVLMFTVVAVSCKYNNDNKDNKPCEHVDADTNYVCDSCGAELAKPEHKHSDADKDHKCDECEDTVGVCEDANSDHLCDYCGERVADCIVLGNSHKCPLCGKTLSDCEVGENSHKCSTCGKVLTGCEAAENSHNCAICNKTLTECEDTDGDYICDVCGADTLPENMERVGYEFNLSGQAAATLSSDLISGKFTVVAGSEIRNRTKTFEGVEYTQSVKIGNAATKIKVDVPGAGKLSFLIQNGSSGAATQFVTVTGPDGTVYDIEFDGNNTGSPVVKIELDVTEGEWIISRGKNGGTQDVFYLALSCVVEKSEENGFELVSTGNVNFLTNQTLDVTGVRLNATFGNGKTDPLDIANVNIDATGVDMTTAGTYPIVLSYKDYEPITYYVNVFAPETIELGYDAVEKLSTNTSYGNGVYYNHSFKELYTVGEEFSAKGLTVFVYGKCGDTTHKFTVSDYTVTGFNSESADFINLTISYADISITIQLSVTDVAPTADANGIYKGLVDPAYEGLPGVISGPYHTFKTIQEALDFFAKIDASAQKEIYIAPGLYKEKLEITIPNLKLIGWGDKPEDVVIEWDSLYGLVDAGGFTHTTDSTQTVAIRESAYNVTIDNLTISNYWNSQERMDEAGLAIERGLALLVQADRFVMTNSRLLGIQDTLELFTGRQYFENVFISGYTDFIFGTNNVTLFKNCTIHVIDTSKDDSGTAGYITAFKGNNKGSADAIVYGAIFYDCDFTADEGLSQGKTAIGRTWGANAAVAIINCELGGHISTAGYDPKENKNKRYISMNGIHPTDSTVQFVEFGNTGAGAITEAVAGMRFLTAEEAALYIDFATIFGTINGGVSFLDPWDPTSTEVVVDDRDYYYFNGSSSSEGTSHTFDTTTSIASGTTHEWDGLLISAENGKVAWNSNANALNMKAGAFIKFTVPAGSLVTVETYPNYNFFTLNGVATASSNMLTQYYAEATEVILLSTGDLYLYSIIINPGEEAPAEATLTEIKVSDFNTNYVVGDELSFEGTTVKAYYSDNSIIFVTDYTYDASALDNTAAGEYDVVFTYGGKSVTIKVTYEDPNAGPEIAKDTYLDFSTPDGLAAVQSNPKVTMTGSIRHNGGEIQISGTISFQVKAGTVITVIPYANTSYASYTIGMEGEANLETLHEGYSFMAMADGTVVYTGLDNNYLVGIRIECPIAEGKYVFGGSSQEGDVTGILASIPGLSISGTCKTHSGGAQLGQDSLISFILPAFATVTIQGYDTNYGQLTVEADGVEVPMDIKAQYVFSADYPVTITIKAFNVGTEDAPAYNKSYITYINVDLPVIFGESTTIDLSATGANIQGATGEYEGLSIDATSGKFADNNGGWTQVNTGTIIKFYVLDGAEVSVTAYSGASNFTIEISDNICTITCIGNDYLNAISIKYAFVYSENTTIDLSATGANIQGGTGTYEGLSVDATTGKFADNNGGWTQVNTGTIITFNVADGATVTVNAYSSADNFTVAIANGVCTITAVGNDYLKAINVAY